MTSPIEFRPSIFGAINRVKLKYLFIFDNFCVSIQVHPESILLFTKPIISDACVLKRTVYGDLVAWYYHSLFIFILI